MRCPWRQWKRSWRRGAWPPRTLCPCRPSPRRWWPPSRGQSPSSGHKMALLVQCSCSWNSQFQTVGWPIWDKLMSFHNVLNVVSTLKTTLNMILYFPGRSGPTCPPGCPPSWCAQTAAGTWTARAGPCQCWSHLIGFKIKIWWKSVNSTVQLK